MMKQDMQKNFIVTACLPDGMLLQACPGTGAFESWYILGTLRRVERYIRDFQM
jgi:hypothetical protein